MHEGGDVVVVGAGIVGSAAAYYLAGEGARVTLIERDAVGSHASGFAFGGLMPLGCDGPDSNRSSTLSELAQRLHRELSSTLPGQTGIDTEFRLKPSVTLALDAREVAGLRQSHEWLKANHCGEVRWLESRPEMESVEPRLGPSVRAALYADISAEVEPYKLTLALAQAAEGRGALIRHGVVSGLSIERGRLNGVRVGTELVAATAVVIAAGPWTHAASEWLGIRIPVEPLKGQILRLRAPGPPLRMLFWWGGDYATTKPDGLVWVGTTEEHVGFDDAPTPQARDQITASAVVALPYLAEAQLVRQTACLRPISADGRPVLGSLEQTPGVVVATGAGRNGIMLGPAMGRVAADLALGKAAPCDIRGRGPDRFGGKQVYAQR
jgi:glycine oxidase